MPEQKVEPRTVDELPPEIEVYEIGARRLYVKTGERSFAISESDCTPEELLCIARDMAARQASLCRPEIHTLLR